LVLGIPVTSFDLRNQAPLFMELCLWQGTLSAKVSITVTSHTRLLPLYQGFTVKPSGLLSFVRPTGSRTKRRPMRINDDHLRMEFMAECLGEATSILNAGELSW